MHLKYCFQQNFIFENFIFENFIFIFIFFISFSHWKIQKNIFIYFLSFSSTPINLLKLISSILFSFIFFHFPTNQINCLNFFFFFCSSLHIVNSKVCFPTCLCAIYLSTQTFTSHIQHVIHTKHIHTTIHQSTLSHTKHTCRVLVLFRAFPR